MSLLVSDSFLAFSYDKLPQAHLVYFLQTLKSATLPKSLGKWNLLADPQPGRPGCSLLLVWALILGLLSAQSFKKSVCLSIFYLSEFILLFQNQDCEILLEFLDLLTISIFMPQPPLLSDMNTIISPTPYFSLRIIIQALAPTIGLLKTT